MRFVHVEDFIHPDAGYQLNLLSKLQVEQGHEVIIVTSELDNVPNFLTSFFGKENIEKRDAAFEERTGVKIYRFPTYRWYSSRAIFKIGLHKFLKQLKPDVLFIHGEDTLTGMKLLWRYKSMKMPYVLDCHMLEMASENKFKDAFRRFFRKFVTPIILKNNIPLIRVVDSDFVEKHFAIPLEKTELLSFGTDVNFFAPSENARKVFRAKYEIGDDDFVVLYAGKLDEYKGGLFFAKTLKDKIVLDNGRKIVFVVVGKTPTTPYGEEVSNLLSTSENRILRFPTQHYPDLAPFYQSADIAVFPKQCSMSYFEVQSCGLPVVLEENEINVERASEKKGLVFEAGDSASFKEMITHFGNMSKLDFDIYRENARQNIVKNYNYTLIAQKFSNVMIQAYRKFHNIEEKATLTS